MLIITLMDVIIKQQELNIPFKEEVMLKVLDL